MNLPAGWPGQDWLAGVLAGLPGVSAMSPHASGGSTAELIDLAAGVAGFALAWLLYAPGRRPGAAALIAREDNVFGVFRGGLGLDALYRTVFARPYRALSVELWKGVDAAMIDGAAMGSGRLLAFASGLVRPLCTGKLSLYLALLVAGLTVILAVLAMGAR